MIKSIPQLISCLKKAHHWKKPFAHCLQAYDGDDWIHYSQYNSNIPCRQILNIVPRINIITFTNFDQSVAINPGVMTIFEGKIVCSNKYTTVNSHKTYLPFRQTISSHEIQNIPLSSILESIQAKTTLIHIESPIPPDKNTSFDISRFLH